jgi:hypothetical protein
MKADQRAITQPGQGIGVDRIEQSPRLVGLEYRRLASALAVLRSAHGVRGIGGNDLADHHPVEEHAQRREALLHCGLRVHL